MPDPPINDKHDRMGVCGVSMLVSGPKSQVANIALRGFHPSRGPWKQHSMGLVSTSVLLPCPRRNRAAGKS
ncbi:hypothetical protein VTL71DRAFT_3624 [Oculimacula yallundae]|uniref:Uncharacterized protein n=1 Tax=Oculimacula yallundae TaxID=86028 RepID=A0ABR4C7U5_9HELO